MGWNENEMERVSHAIVRPFSQAPKCLCERLTSSMDYGQGHSSSRRSFLSSLLIHIHSSSLSPLFSLSFLFSLFPILALCSIQFYSIPLPPSVALAPRLTDHQPQTLTHAHAYALLTLSSATASALDTHPQSVRGSPAATTAAASLSILPNTPFSPSDRPPSSSPTSCSWQWDEHKRQQYGLAPLHLLARSTRPAPGDGSWRRRAGQ